MTRRALSALRTLSALHALLVTGLLCLPGVSAPLLAQTLAHRGWAGSGIDVPPWWTSAVVYRIDPLTFQDSDGDGFGDLPGIVSRLDYVKSLGVDAILLSPFQIAHGTPRAAQDEEDFARLVSEAGRRQIRVLVDLPLAGGDGAPGSVVSMARFWLSRGAAGLRVTASAGMAAEPMAEALDLLRRTCADYGGERLLLFEGAQGPLARAQTVTDAHLGLAGRHRAPRTSYRSPHRAAVSQSALLQVIALSGELPQLTSTGLGAVLRGAPAALASDTPEVARSIDRYADQLADGAGREALARIIAALLLTTKAMPVLLYGQELGMATTPASASAPGEPLPMQWDAAHGFTEGVPWLEMGRSAATANVAVEDADARSLLHWYRRLSVLHHASAALRTGSLTVLTTAQPEVLAWVRQAPRSSTLAPPVVVLVNLSRQAVSIPLSSALAPAAVHAAGEARLRTLASSEETAPASVPVNGVVLPAYGVYVGELQAQPGLETQPVPSIRPRRRSR